MNEFDPEAFKAGSFGCHEALHMAYVLANLVDERLAQHPAILLRPEWKAKVEAACATLHELYQEIGAAHL